MVEPCQAQAGEDQPWQAKGEMGCHGWGGFWNKANTNLSGADWQHPVWQFAVNNPAGWLDDLAAWYSLQTMATFGHYFDCNATTPVSEVARQAWLQASSEHWQNPSSLYRGAGRVARLLEEERNELAELLGVDEEGLVFTSGATEANNAVMEHAAKAGDGKSLAVISAIEHPSVREAAEKWFGKDRLREVGVDPQGRVCVDGLEKTLAGGGVAVVSVMAANNETGVIQPWRRVGELCRRQGVAYHCDAAQWIGKEPLQGLGDCDFLTGSAHKFGGPKGMGFLQVAGGMGKGFRSLVGGPQQGGMRAGTEDYPGVVAMMVALKERLGNLSEERSAGHLRRRQAFESRVVAGIPGLEVVAAGADRLWNTVMLILPLSGPTNVKWLVRLDRLGFAVSTGSACSAGKGNPSHVMGAMGLGFDQMGRVLRISGGWDTGDKHWDALADALLEVWGNFPLRQKS